MQELWRRMLSLCALRQEAPMTRKLTEKRLTGARKPATGQTVLWDSAITGLGVRILPGGSKTFWFQYRPQHGKRTPSGAIMSRAVRIGTWPSISLADARKRAHDLAGQVARGQNPAAEREETQRRACSTLRTLLAADGPYHRELEEREIVSRKVIMSGLNRGLAKLMSMDVADLTRADFVAAIAAVKAAGKPGAAAELRKYCRGFLEWCVSSGCAHHNVLAGLRTPKRSRAERLKAAGNGGRALSDDESARCGRRPAIRA